MSLERLAPELISLILRSVDSPQHLHHLISASPICLRVFSQFPQSILTSVIKTWVPAEVLPHLLAVLHASTALGDVTTHSPANKAKLLAFLDQYFSNDPFQFPTSKKDLIKLCRVFFKVCSLVGLYFDHAMHELAVIDPGDTQSPTSDELAVENTRCSTSLDYSPTAMSSFELHRVQRGFLRFELYCNVFPIGIDIRFQTMTASVFSSADQFNLFIQRLKPWEVEEILCIHHFFVFAISKVIDDLGNKLVASVLAAPGARLPTPDSSSTDPGTTQVLEIERSDGLVNLDMSHGCLDMFSNDARDDLPRSMSSIVSLGLDFMLQFLRASPSRKSHLVRENYRISRDFLTEALGNAPEHGPRSVHHDDVHDDKLLQANLGYYLFKYNPDEVYLKSIAYEAASDLIRQTGYVFWDAERILNPGVHDKLRRAKAGDFTYSGSKTAEERLERVRLPKQELIRIEREFGYIE